VGQKSSLIFSASSFCGAVCECELLFIFVFTNTFLIDIVVLVMLSNNLALHLIEVLKSNRVYMERWLRVPPKKWAPACRQAGIDFSNSPHCI